MTPLRVGLSCLLWALALPLLAEPKTILALELDHRFMPGRDTQYNRLFYELRQVGFDYQLQFMPINRVWRGIGLDPTACTFPTSISAVVSMSMQGLTRQTLVQSDFVDHVRYRAVVRAGQPKIQSIQQLEGKTVAAWTGIPNRQLAGVENVQIIETHSEESRVLMLYNDRVDVMFGFVPDLHLVSEKLNLPQPDSSDTLVIWDREEGTRLVCHDTPSNRQTIESFNQALSVVRETGKLREILGPYADLD